MKALLSLGRTVGIKNFSELKGLIRALQRGEHAGTCHLETDTTIRDALLKFNQNTVSNTVSNNELVKKFNKNVNIYQNLLRNYFPQYNAPKVKAIADITYKRFGEKSGIVKLESSSINEQGVQIGNGSIKIMGNRCEGNRGCRTRKCRCKT